MTDIYTLEGPSGNCLGVFTTPEKAMRAYYLSDIMQTYRGYKSDIEPVVWVNSSDIHWYGYRQSEYNKPFFEGKRCAEIHISRIDSEGYDPNTLIEFAVSKGFVTEQTAIKVISRDQEYQDRPPFKKVE